MICAFVPLRYFGRGFACFLLLLLVPCAALAQKSEPGVAELEATSWSGSLAGAITELPDSPKPQGSSSAPQQTAQTTASPATENDLSIAGTPKRILKDELHAILSPAHVHAHDLRWLLPVAAGSAAAFATDSYTMRNVVSSDAGFNAAGENSSNALLGIAIGGPAALFAVGELTHSEHPREAGLLSGEAMADALILDEGIKYITLRERPTVDNANGHFWSSQGVSNPSFVSGHSIVAWSSAAVLAEEYSRPWQQIGIYTLASGVSLTRVLAQQHFPSDVLLGGVSGWLIGHYVFRAHHRTGVHPRV